MTYSDRTPCCARSLETGARGNEHSPPHTQAMYIAEGKFAFTIGGETKNVEKGDSVLMPPNAVHSVLCLEAGKLVDVFTLDARGVCLSFCFRLRRAARTVFLRSAASFCAARDVQ
ncbi:MAG: cupin domain-containing protein [Oscillospiraceae bacterium]